MNEKEREERLTKVFALLVKRAEGKILSEEKKLEIIYNKDIVIDEQSAVERLTS